MQVEPIVSFRGMATSPALRKKIMDRIGRLEQFHPRITSCHVVVDAPHRRQKGNVYKVSLNLAVPGHHVSVNRASDEEHAHEDVYVAVRDTFDEAQRQLEDFVRKSSENRTRTPDIPMKGEVNRMSREDGFGFITALDGRDVYFSLERMPQKIADELAVATPVRFLIGEADTGPYAHSISIVETPEAD